MTDANNRVTTYGYDALNRLVSKQSSDTNTPAYTYAYDSCATGRLCGIQQNGGFHFYFGYDGLGRLNYQLNATGATWLYSSYAYTPGGRLTSITYPNNRMVNYTYNALGQVSKVSTTKVSTVVLADTVQFHPFGPLKSFTFGNGLTYRINVDQAYRPVLQISGPRTRYAYYDAASNLQTLNSFNNTAQTFSYDALDELVGASDTQAGSYGNLGYTYIKNSHRKTEVRNGATTTYNYLGTNRLYSTDTQFWLYDAAGNVRSGSALGYLTYDGYGRFTSALSGAASYGYNAFDQRTQKTAGGVTTSFHYGPNGELLYETDGSTNRAYVYLNNMPLARIDNGVIYYYHTDQLGAPQVMTDSAGTTVWKASYEPFGGATVTVSTVTNNLRDPGQYFDQETGLFYWGARYYDPRIGRGTSPDRMGVAWHVRRYQANLGVPNQPPLEINPYVAFANNPLRWSDPTGLWSITAGGYIGVGGEVTFGSDAGNGFLTGRFGFGLGGGVSYDPNGGIPGPAPKDPTKGGVVLSCSAQANFNAGPLTGSLEGGAARNYSNDQSSIYGGPSANFSPDVFHGLSITGSAGGQFTFYTGRTGR